MSFQTRTSIASLCQSLYFQLQTLSPDESQGDSLQSHLDAILAWTNDKTKDSKQELIQTVDSDRTKRREKEKSRDKDKKKDVVTEQPTAQ